MKKREKITEKKLKKPNKKTSEYGTAGTSENGSRLQLLCA